MGMNIFAGTQDSGVYRSTDGGGSWIPARNGLFPNAQIQALAVSGSYVYAGTFEEGVFRSIDTGNSWQAVNTGLPPNPSVVNFAVLGTKILINTLADGVFLSTDTGLSWTSLHWGWSHPYVSSLLSDGRNFFAGTDSEGVFLSSDSGRSWSAVSSGFPDAFVLTFARDDSNLYAGTYSKGVWRRPLSEMINLNAVAETTPTENSITTYPNPLSQSTTINFSSPESGAVEVTIVNLLGTEVKRIFSGELSSGEHQFSWDASGVPPGMYECVVRADGKSQEIPIVLEH
jgi:hypothetical protein